MYIGQTCCPLKTRIDEHKAAITHVKTDESAVAEHVTCQDKHHQVDLHLFLSLHMNVICTVAAVRVLVYQNILHIVYCLPTLHKYHPEGIAVNRDALAT
jgi:hypothetical protein